MNERSVFLAALEILDPTERAAYLDRACPDPAARRAVDELLDAHARSGTFMPEPGVDDATAAHTPSADTPGAQVGPYKLRERIGEGGMGEVWVADQLEPIKRRVALKLVKPGMDSRSVLGRFEAERQALALMDHPNIAKVLDAGATPDGRPYFVMELVKGTPITEFCDARKLTPRERLELFVPVCQAIQHAHQKGIIHRDIKPSNVLVELHDDRMVPKVIDFGVAKAVGQQLTEKTIYTGYGSLVGTPAYMAPEQAAFNALDIDTRADVYALGVLLYELLAGSPPIEKERLKKAALDEVLRLVREEEPPRPSARLSTSQAKASIAATRQSGPAELSALMRGELDWIVMRCLEKDRARRYDAASALAKDVERYLKGDAVEACPPTLGYRLRKAYRRNRPTVLVGGAFAAVLLAAAGVSAWLAVQARDAERAAVDERDEKEKARLAEAEQRAAADRERREALAAADRLKSAQKQIRETQYGWDMQILPTAFEAGQAKQVRELLDRHRPAPGEVDLRGFEWHHWDRQSQAELVTRELLPADLQDPAKWDWQWAFSPEGRKVAALGTQRKQITFPPVAKADDKNPPKPVEVRIFVWDTATGRQLASHSHTVASGVGFSFFSRDGSSLVGLAGDPSPGASNENGWHRVHVWDTATGRVRFEYTSPDDKSFFKFADISPDGRRLAVVVRTGDPKRTESAAPVYDLATGKESFRVPCTGMPWFSPDGGRFVGSVTTEGGEDVKTWDATTGKELSSWKAALNEPNSPSLGWSPNGKLVLGVVRVGPEAKRAREVKAWDAATGKEVFSVTLDPVPEEWRRSTSGEWWGFIPSPDGSRLAIDGPRAVVVVAADSGRELCRLDRKSEPLQPLTFSPDGQQMVAFDRRAMLTVWDAATSTVVRRYAVEDTAGPQLAGYWMAAFTPTGDRVYAVHTQGILTVLTEWNARPPGGRLDGYQPWSGGRLRAGGIASTPVVSPDGRRVATVIPSGDGPDAGDVVRVWDADTGATLHSLTARPWPPGKRYRGFARIVFSPDGARVSLVRPASVTGQPAVPADVTVWDVATGREVGYFESPARTPGNGLLVTPDGTRAVVLTGYVTPQEKGVEAAVHEVATGKLVVTHRLAVGEHEYLRQNLTAMELTWRFPAISPDGRRLLYFRNRPVTIGKNGPDRGTEPDVMKLFDLTDGRELRSVEFKESVDTPAWSPDGRQIHVWTREAFGGLEQKPVRVRCFEGGTGSDAGEFTIPRSTPKVSFATMLTFSPDGRRVAVLRESHEAGTPCGVTVYDTATGRDLLTLEFGGQVRGGEMAMHAECFAFSADGYRLVAVGLPRGVREGGGVRGGAPPALLPTGPAVVTVWDATPRPEPAK